MLNLDLKINNDYYDMIVKGRPAGEQGKEKVMGSEYD
jgi:hypothetical protein